eukprot:evm.model.scf_2721.1 EVM.evm.TU.scf_2721.1   scf_2721:3359-3661(-)
MSLHFFMDPGDRQLLNATSDALQGMWQESPNGRFQYIVTIFGATGSVPCAGTLVSNWSVVTVASCLENIGSHPTVYLSAQDEGMCNAAESDGELRALGLV